MLLFGHYSAGGPKLDGRSALFSPRASGCPAGRAAGCAARVFSACRSAWMARVFNTLQLPTAAQGPLIANRILDRLGRGKLSDDVFEDSITLFATVFANSKQILACDCIELTSRSSGPDGPERVELLGVRLIWLRSQLRRHRCPPSCSSSREPALHFYRD